MRTYPSRLTTQCPVCGGQVVAHVRFPLPEHWGVKPVEIVDLVCATSGCDVTQAQVRQLMRL